jgi:hypothetical protein
VTLQAPPVPSAGGHDIDAGVIEDARARQHRHRRVGATVAIAAAIATGLILGFAGGGNGSQGDGSHARNGGAPGRGSGNAAHQAGNAFAGAPKSQAAAIDGPSSQQCPLAAPSRFLPPRSGCVTAMHADVTGDGRTDLVLVYSRLNRVSSGYVGGPPIWRRYFGATQAFLMIVLPDGTRISARINGVKAVTIVAVGHVNSDPGSEIFLQTFHISSGSDAVAYGLSHGLLVPAGATLAYGGDSGLQAGFTCSTTGKPHLVQRTFVLGSRYGWSMETNVTYSWNGPKLVQIAKRSFKRRGWPARSEAEVGSGCGPVS